MKIYTRVGDDGRTALIGGQRVAKSDRRIAAYGSVDELNAQLGVCRAHALPAEMDASIERIQHEMFAIGAELAAPQADQRDLAQLSDRDVQRLESEIDQFEASLSPLTNFILPAGSSAAASLHVARCVCRRAEREVVSLTESSDVRGVILGYLNRVGDFLFVLARSANAAAGVTDVAWKKKA
ncbi:MAG: cob(I)yrinic acid a,c-diamide adenosyltransferase [Planctomycetota bacterium]